jgi:insulysin
LTILENLQPDQFIVNLLGHEGQGSVLSELKKLRWCSSLNCDHVKYANGFGFFEIKVDLTDDGEKIKFKFILK